jgi:hypothetical protein
MVKDTLVEPAPLLLSTIETGKDTVPNSVSPALMGTVPVKVKWSPESTKAWLAEPPMELKLTVIELMAVAPEPGTPVTLKVVLWFRTTVAGVALALLAVTGVVRL